VEKTKRGSEAAQRVATVEPGQGILGFMKVYAWYAGTTGLALKRRTEMVMSPPTPSRVEDIANILEHWAEQVRMLSGFGTAHRLPAAYKITALAQIMKNKKDKFEEFEDQARDQFSNDEERQFDAIFSKVMEFATRRRLEANQARLKGDLMDCNRVGAEPEQHHGHQHEYPCPEQFNWEGYDQSEAFNGYPSINQTQGGAFNGYPSINQTNYGGGLNPFNQDWYPHDIDAFGKGKGKGGKGGKGQDTRWCYVCGKQGHISRDCRSPKAAELRAKGIIGSPGIKGFPTGWGTKGFKGGWEKGKGKGTYGGKGKGINEF
jgi:hypothetical protein